MHGLDAKEQVFFGGRRTIPVDRLLSKVSNNLAAWAVMYVLERPYDLRQHALHWIKPAS